MIFRSTARNREVFALPRATKVCWQTAYNMESWFSLEERMGCGFGACAGCPANLRMPDGSIMKKGVCKLGPVFPGEDVIFQ